MPEPINLDLVEIALDRIEGTAFEKFVNAFYPTLAGEHFVPLGGTGDGGADAFQDAAIFESTAAGVFYQASRVEDFRTKIRSTIRRLKEVGRKVQGLIYVTPLRIPRLDKEEIDLSGDVGANIRIRDRAYIQSHINDSLGTRAAFETYLAPAIRFLEQVGAPKLLQPTHTIASPAIYVFLRQEVERAEGNAALTDAIADGLILWALEGTDPDAGSLLSTDEVRRKINDAVPNAATVLGDSIPRRLRQLAAVAKPYGRPVRWHRKEDAYCLSFDMRARLLKDNAEDEALRLRVTSSLQNRIQEIDRDHETSDHAQKAAEYALSAVQRTLEREGLEFAAFLQGEIQDAAIPAIADHVDDVLDSAGESATRSLHLKELALKTLQGAFYQSTPDERVYLSRMATTFTVLFCLRTDPRIVEYLQNMTADFHLFVGSDLIVRALSERFLRPEDQITRNALRLIRQAGGVLVLAEPVLDEVYTHIRAADIEFESSYERVEASITEAIYRSSDRILIRAYFYARRTPPAGIKGPTRWADFVDSFCDFRVVRTPEGREQVRKYLVAEFGLQYESRKDLMDLVDAREVEEIARRLKDYKKRRELALNDALMILAVYGRRRARKETASVSQYGFRTWWLTGESRVLVPTRELVRQQGAGYLMRSDFVVRFLSLAPSATEVRRVCGSMFPSLLGVKLTRRISSGEMKKVLSSLADAQHLEEGRRLAKIADLSDRLKLRFYEKHAAAPAESGNELE